MVVGRVRLGKAGDSPRVKLDGGNGAATALRGDHVAAFVKENHAIVGGQNGEGQARILQRSQQDFSRIAARSNEVQVLWRSYVRAKRRAGSVVGPEGPTPKEKAR
jgi:hypothetical protein